MRVTSHTIAALRYRAGFSLIEMAVVLMILGFVLGGLLVSLGQTTENTRRTDATSQLKRIEEALYGFAQANGRLPCPANNTSAGAEAPVGGGNCTVSHGFVPAATLGLSGAVNTDGLLTDPWGNPFRYSVANASNGSGRSYTSTAGLSTTFSTPPFPTAGNPGSLRICDDAPCDVPTGVIADSIPAVVLSMGANWGSFTSPEQVANAGNTTLGGYRITNTNDFVSTGYNETDFDDIITWLSPNILFSRMISAGRLP